MKNLELLKISIRARIEDYDNFFKHNFTDYRIPFFEKQKFRLRKLLFEAANNNFEPRELEIKMGADEIITSVKTVTQRQERAKTPNNAKTASTNILDKQKQTPNSKNVLLKVKMTKEEHDEYMKQSERVKKEVAKPVSTTGLPTTSVKKAPIKSKRV